MTQCNVLQTERRQWRAGAMPVAEAPRRPVPASPAPAGPPAGLLSFSPRRFPSRSSPGCDRLRHGCIQKLHFYPDRYQESSFKTHDSTDVSHRIISCQYFLSTFTIQWHKKKVLQNFMLYWFRKSCAVYTPSFKYLVIAFKRCTVGLHSKFESVRILMLDSFEPCFNLMVWAEHVTKLWIVHMWRRSSFQPSQSQNASFSPSNCSFCYQLSRLTSTMLQMYERFSENSLNCSQYRTTDFFSEVLYWLIQI